MSNKLISLKISQKNVILLNISLYIYMYSKLVVHFKIACTGNEGTPFYSQREMNEMMKKHQQELDAQKLANQKQQENFDKMVTFLSQLQGMSELTRYVGTG